jgi:hypothetical protein
VAEERKKDCCIKAERKKETKKNAGISLNW